MQPTIPCVAATGHGKNYLRLQRKHGIMAVVALLSIAIELPSSPRNPLNGKSERPLPIIHDLDAMIVWHEDASRRLAQLSGDEQRKEKARIQTVQDQENALMRDIILGYRGNLPDDAIDDIEDIYRSSYGEAELPLPPAIAEAFAIRHGEVTDRRIYEDES